MTRERKASQPKHEGQQARHQQHHQRREPEHVEAVPVPGQLLVVQEHHEVGQDRIAVDAAAADLAHQVHAHGVAAEREERAVAEREDAAIAPDQIDRRAPGWRSRHICRTAPPDRSAPGTSSPPAAAGWTAGSGRRGRRPPARKTVALRSSERVSTCGIMLPPPGP